MLSGVCQRLSAFHRQNREVRQAPEEAKVKAKAQKQI
jgi:hypothetical protein